MSKVLTYTVLALLLLFSTRCRKDEPESATPGMADVPVAQPSSGPKPRNMRLGGQDDSPEDRSCRAFLRLTARCAREQGQAADENFHEEFLRNCKKEFKRDTRYSKTFAACAASSSCQALATCTLDVEKAALEHGPEQVRFLLRRGARSDAKQFCWSNRHLVEKSEEMDGVCHALLEELAKQKGRQKHVCPFHEH